MHQSYTEPTWMRAAALGSEELIRTGCEISMLCLLLSWVVLWLTDRAENECRFLAFFFPSPLRWPEPFPLGGEAIGDDPRLQEPRRAGSELVPGAFAGIGLSISINCFAVSFNWEERRDMVQVSDLTVTPQHTRVRAFTWPFLACSYWQLFKPTQER